MTTKRVLSHFSLFLTLAWVSACEFTVTDIGGDQLGKTPAPGGASPVTAATGLATAYATCPAPVGTGKTYTIGLGAGTAQVSGPQSLSAFTHWNDLAAGDIVCIYGQTNPYYERLVLVNSGTSAAPIRVVGVLGNGGVQPILSGRGATTSSAFNYSTSFIEYYEGGEVSISGDATTVSYVNVEGLTIEGGTTAYPAGSTSGSPNGYTDASGAKQVWSCGAAGIYLIGASNISLINNIVKDNDNGIFVSSNNGHTSSNIQILNNYIYGNGMVGDGLVSATNPSGCSLYAHGTYTEANGIRYAFNRFGALRSGSGAIMLKDRSAALVVEFNLCQGNGVLESSSDVGDAALVGTNPSLGHILDLVESYDSTIAFYNLGAIYYNVAVRGNIFWNQTTGGAATAIHFGGDQEGDPTNYRRTDLWFYNNTFVNNTGSEFLMENGTTLHAWNDLFSGSGNIANYTELLGTPGTYDSTLTSASLFNFSGFESLSNGNLNLVAGSPAIGAGQNLEASTYPATPQNFPLEYVDYMSSQTRPSTTANLDYGALGYSGKK